MTVTEIDFEDNRVVERTPSLANYICCVTYSILSSLVSIVVSAHFYHILLHAETLTNCTSIATSPNKNLHNFCEHLSLWKLCAFYGMLMPGCLLLIFAAIALYTLKDSSINSQILRKIFHHLFLIVRALNIIVLTLLWKSNITFTYIIGTYGLIAAARLYILFLGLELGMASVMLLIALVCYFCK